MRVFYKHRTIANYASDWLTRQVNQSKAWFPKYLPSYISKSLAHDPALNQKWEEKKISFLMSSGNLDGTRSIFLWGAVHTTIKSVAFYWIKCITFGDQSFTLL